MKGYSGRDPFNRNSNRSDREKRTTSKGGPVFSKLFRLDRTDPLSFGPKFPESLVEWIAPSVWSVCSVAVSSHAFSFLPIKVPCLLHVTSQLGEDCRMSFVRFIFSDPLDDFCRLCAYKTLYPTCRHTLPHLGCAPATHCQRVKI